MPTIGATWPMPAAPKKTAVTNIQQIWPTQIASEPKPEAKPHVQQAQAPKQGSEQHFPFASAGEAARSNWPTTALSFAPAAALAPN
jgi:hypothetical protein